MSRVRGVMVDGRLEPTLTKLDRQVLAAIPFDGSLWELGEGLDILDVRWELVPTLRGLRSFGYVSGPLGPRRVMLQRTARGDAALRDTGGQA